MADLNVINAEALRVGPDEVLIIRLNSDADEEVAKDLLDYLREVGLEKRSLVFTGDVEFAIVQREKSQGIPADYADSAE